MTSTSAYSSLIDDVLLINVIVIDVKMIITSKGSIKSCRFDPGEHNNNCGMHDLESLPVTPNTQLSHFLSGHEKGKG